MNTEFKTVQKADEDQMIKLDATVAKYNSLYRKVRSELLAHLLRNPLRIEFVDGVTTIEDGKIKFSISETEMTVVGDCCVTREGLGFRLVPLPKRIKANNLMEAMESIRDGAFRQLVMEDMIGELETARKMIPTD